MKPSKVDLPIIWRGCDYAAILLKWKDQLGNPLNLTGWVPKAASVRINLNASVTDYVNGVTQITLSKTQTANLRLGTEQWDWIWEKADGSSRLPPFLAGTVPIKDPTTNGQ